MIIEKAKEQGPTVHQVQLRVAVATCPLGTGRTHLLQIQALNQIILDIAW